MHEHNIVEEVKKLAKNNDFESAFSFLNSQIRQRSDYVEYQVLMVVLLIQDEVYDIDKALKVIDQSRRDIRLAILKAYIERYYKGVISKSTFELLSSWANIEFNGYYKYLPFLSSWYYQQEKLWDDVYKALVLSISVDTTSVYNFKALADYYHSIGAQRNAEINARRALMNVLKVGEVSVDIDPFSFDEIVLEHIAGISLSTVNYDWLKKDCSRYIYNF